LKISLSISCRPTILLRMVICFTHTLTTAFESPILGTRVVIPIWQSQCRAHRRLFRRLILDSLPATIADLDWIAPRAFGAYAWRIVSDEICFRTPEGDGFSIRLYLPPPRHESGTSNNQVHPTAAIPPML
jgi:hypothetical protein